MPSRNECHVCGLENLGLVQRYGAFKRVASDCTPWRDGGRLGICSGCGCVQTVADESWRDEAAQIYRNYSIWHQSGGAEQKIFDPNSGQAARSTRILERLLREVALPSSGRLLDIGCGNGSLLRTASRLMPDWMLYGNEFDERSRPQIEAIAGIERLYTGPLENIPEQFDLVTLSHVFEHWVSPCGLLKRLTAMLKPGGLVLIQVPDYTENPFELLVADHCTHFSPVSLGSVVRRAGYHLRALSTDWVPREITIVAQPETTTDYGFLTTTAEDAASCVAAALVWLDELRLRAIRVKTRQHPGEQFGIFGTSIAGTWLFNELSGQVSFFVDEDIQRAGRSHLDLPIFLPRDVPANSCVFVALPDSVAASVSARLRPNLAAGVALA